MRRTASHRTLAREAQRRVREGRAPTAAPRYERPGTRGQCPTARPCPFVGCRYHLCLDVRPRTGSIMMPYGDAEPETLIAAEDTCALDVAERGEQTLEAVAQMFHLTRERVRQIELKALRHLDTVLPGNADVPGALRLGPIRRNLRRMPDAPKPDDAPKKKQRQPRVYGVVETEETRLQKERHEALRECLGRIADLMAASHLKVFGNARVEVVLR